MKHVFNQVHAWTSTNFTLDPVFLMIKLIQDVVDSKWNNVNWHYSNQSPLIFIDQYFACFLWSFEDVSLNSITLIFCHSKILYQFYFQSNIAAAVLMVVKKKRERDSPESGWTTLANNYKYIIIKQINYKQPFFFLAVLQSNNTKAV